MIYKAKELVETADISQGKETTSSKVKNVLSVVIVFVVIYFSLGLMADLIAYNIPEKYEAQLSMWEGTVIEKDDEEYKKFQHVNKIFVKLAADKNLRPLPYKLFFVEMPEPNAMAVPGGGVGVTRGFLQEVISDEGLAMVLSHELGHHQHRHTLRSLGRGILWMTFSTLVFGDSDGSYQATSTALNFANAGHSRHQETEADDFGINLAHKHYGPSEKYTEFFQKIHEDHEEGNGRWDALLRTHPYSKDRIVRIKNILKDLKPAKNQ
jgi:Zn-dependent protease with chaperone function